MTRNGKKSMPQHLRTEEEIGLKEAIFSTLAFFSLYDLPLSSQRVHELLLRKNVNLEEVVNLLENLSTDNKIYKAGNLYSLKPWKADDLRNRQIEISKKWYKI